ncbi:hypothetical protein [Methylomicrobium lacus]|uniref:hypothetical protein n=1 Tax=Methylomicrobium lacus TaxID=136992 RepID=UPI0035A8B65C
MNALAEALKRLLDSDEPLTASAFTPHQRKQLEQFALSTRLIDIGKQGRGTLYRIVNRPSVIAYLQQLQPLAEDELPDAIPVRGKNIGTHRDSKKGKSGHESCYLLIKAWDKQVVWRQAGKTLNPAELTENFGVAALQIGRDAGWHSNRPLLLVENQALFDCCDWLPEGFNGSLAYYAGQLPDVLLQWLAAETRTDEVILFPDYDGIGLANYARLIDALHPATRLHFYWLPDWQDKIARFGNQGAWLKTRVQFEAAIAKLDAMQALTDDFKQLASLSQRHGKALEQEAIWL